MDEAECRTADWRAIGYVDGAEGRHPSHFGERRKACARHGVAADFDAYLAGRSQGLAQFCRPRNGYRLGSLGRTYPSVCPAGLEEAFAAAHAEGYGLHTRRLALYRVQKRLRYSKKRAREVEHLLTEHTVLLVAPDTEVSERAAVAVELKQLAEEKAELDATIRDLERERAAAAFEYERYRDSVAARREG